MSGDCAEVRIGERGDRLMPERGRGRPIILRRLTEHVKAQNWFAVGLQVSNWNAARTDSDRARAYLERLANDLESDIVTGERKQSFRSEVAAFGAAGLAFAETGSLGGKSQWDLLIAYFHASRADEYQVSDATYEELKKAGELGLIRNEPIREALGAYYTLGSNPILTERPRYREHVRGIIPINLQTYIWTNCFKTGVRGAVHPGLRGARARGRNRRDCHADRRR